MPENVEKFWNMNVGWYGMLPPKKKVKPPDKVAATYVLTPLLIDIPVPYTHQFFL